ncbi:hypothetical protein QJS10_CPB17g00687 [Acorus calamus]|uniref:Uncharacterized protein n=1 Tax=Acorus calamus TaxID=4465 RepID=A0AAV9CR59_ACOCL|nr:hypothetical protein QJS10_CPB17g00687 [Acorus calamus]
MESSKRRAKVSMSASPRPISTNTTFPNHPTYQPPPPPPPAAVVVVTRLTRAASAVTRGAQGMGTT